MVKLCEKCGQKLISSKQKNDENSKNDEDCITDIISDEKDFWKNYKNGDSYGKWMEKWIGSFR